MRQYTDELISMLEVWPAKLSISSVALAISESFGGGEWMLKAVQYLAFIDLVMQVFAAIRCKTLSINTFIKGTAKIVSLYAALIILGIGTHALDVTTGGLILFNISGSALYDFFILYLIAGELVCINNRCADIGLPLNKQLAVFFKVFNNTVERKLKELISRDK